MKQTNLHNYSINHHIAWCQSTVNQYIVGKIKEFLKDQIPTFVEPKNWEILELQITPDHIHLFISTPPHESTVGIVKVLKGVTGLRWFNSQILCT